MTILRLILGDQLNADHQWFATADDKVTYLLAELPQETGYVRHHVQKVCGFFAAMGQFASQLRDSGHRVMHLTLDETCNDRDLSALVHRLCRCHGFSHFEYQRPDEFRLMQQLAELETELQADGVITQLHESDHFLLSFAQINAEFPEGKPLKMEHFYRRMRRRFDILIQEGKPEGGRWNYDVRNRQRLTPADIPQLPAPLLFSNDVTGILSRLKKHGVKTVGQAQDELLWPVNQQQARMLLEHFIRYCLPLFGRFQDAMTCRSPHSWSLYHSRLAFALNCKMLNPLEVITAALQAYHAGLADIASVEGFIRQILGWREYVRGIYWRNMPHYRSVNALAAHRSLPAFFWHGKTNMRCMAEAIGQSLEYAYAHHIQRLMVTGNFCLLWQVEPAEVDAWYLGIYMDAIEWVEMPNTRGMGLFADGGLIATKPYSASGNYINRMSDYCKHCQYDVSQRSSDNACPINSLYWDFMLQHRERLSANPRVGMIYRSWDGLDEYEQQACLQRAAWLRDNPDTL